MGPCVPMGAMMRIPARTPWKSLGGVPAWRAEGEILPRATQAKEVASKWQLAENSCSRSPLLHQLYYYRLTTWGRPQTLHPQEIPVFFPWEKAGNLQGLRERHVTAKEYKKWLHLQDFTIASVACSLVHCSSKILLKKHILPRDSGSRVMRAGP